MDVGRRVDRGQLATRISHLGRRAGKLLALKPQEKGKRFRRLHSVTAKAIKGKVAGLMSENIDRILTKLFISPVVGLLTYLACKTKTLMFDAADANLTKI